VLPADDRLKLAVLGKLIVTVWQLHMKKLIIQIYKVVCNRANVWRQMSASMQQYGIVKASLRHGWPQPCLHSSKTAKTSVSGCWRGWYNYQQLNNCTRCGNRARNEALLARRSSQYSWMDESFKLCCRSCWFTFVSSIYVSGHCSWTIASTE
jgi:hypothetical protein